MPQKKGYVMTAEHRAAIGAAQKGRRATTETKAAMSAAKKGIPKSDETKAKMRAAKLGTKQAPEHKAKRLAAVAASVARRRAMKPAYLILGTEIGTWVQWFPHGETTGQISAALTLFTSPKGSWRLLSEDASAAEVEAFTLEHENLRPLPQMRLHVVK